MSRNYCLKQTMLNSIGMFVIILICWKFCWVCVVAIPNTRVFFACETAELMESTVRRSIAIGLRRPGR